MAEKMRVHILAKELNVPSKLIVEKCRAEGIDSVKNHMSTLSAGLHATILEWFSEGSHDSALETSAPVDLKKARIKKKRKPKTAEEVTDGEAGVTTVAKEPAPTTEDEGPVTLVAEAPPEEPVGAVPVAEVAEVPPSEAALPVEVEGSVVEPPAPPAQEETAVAEIAKDHVAELPPGPAETVQLPEEEVEPVAPVEEVPEGTEPIKPVGPQHVPAPAKLQGPRVVRYEAPDYDARPPRRGPSTRKEGDARPAEKDRPGAPAPPLEPAAELPRQEVKGAGPGRRRVRINPRRAAGRLAEAGERLAEWRDRDLLERKERLAGATGRRMVRRRTHQPGGERATQTTQAPVTEVTVHEPVRLKEFCSATGLSFIQLFQVLKNEHDIIANINMTLPTETAELLALHFGLELNVVPMKTALDNLEEEFAVRERLRLQPRPPVVTMLGHVDHGKTSLLDTIRKTRVAPGEDGGITQHIGAYYVETAQGAVTFLDTPGHAAFTAMRARGAHMTDVVVLIVAADDGVMPQTVEAINHAKAAGVPIVVALNKIDLGDENTVQIYGQLAQHGLTPAGEWGGDIDVIPTSAITGAGVEELVEHLAALSSVIELRADPTLPATGTVVEAEMKTGVGAVARVLVQDGTLRVGDNVVCGNAAGKVRALVDDRGRRIQEAAPSIPVEVWGLDDVPAAGDKLYHVSSAQRAKDIAAETKHNRIENARQASRKVNSLQEMLKQRDADEIPELNVVIKADVDGSVAALRQSLAAIPSEDVKLAFRHAGVGAVNDSDALLASTCRGIIIAFRVDVSLGARRLAESHGVDIRSYRVIYDVCDDIKKALEGLLAPDESIEMRGTAEVRSVFHLSKKAGVVAGSYITDGTIDRKHLAKVVRDGVLVREGAEIASLRRFKDDVKEVRSGFECGIRLEGFDDIHVGDIIQTYEIVKTARTL